MATSFQGWANSWGSSWGSVALDLNAMSGVATFSFVASLQVSAGEMQGSASFTLHASGALEPVSAAASKSGVNRLWLIEYYTKAFAAKEAALKAPRTAKAKAAAQKRAIAHEAEVELLVAKAEADIEVLTQGIKDAQAAQTFTYNLIKQAQALPVLETDFLAIANGYRERMQREDDELLLLSMIV